MNLEELEKLELTILDRMQRRRVLKPDPYGRGDRAIEDLEKAYREQILGWNREKTLPDRPLP